MGVETYDKKGDRPMFLRLLIAVRPCAAEDGQSLAEYGLILALVALVCVAGVTAIGLAIAGMFGDVTGTI